MFKHVLSAAALLSLAAGLAIPASASSISYSAVMSGANEVPSNPSTATGFVNLTLTGDSLSIVLVYSGLTTVASAGHIHCCAGPGANAPVAVPFVGLPSAVSGSYSNTFDLTLASTYTSAFITASGGTAAGAEAALILALNSGLTYANIHNATYPGGEIRGYLTAATPEPNSLLLLATGLSGIASIFRTKFRSNSRFSSSL